MDSYHIRGGISLKGEIQVSGAKNAALPILAATVAAEGESRICRCPCLTDVNAMTEILRALGCRVRRVGSCIEADSSTLTESVIPSEWMGSMRSSVFLMGPLLARTGKAVLTFPGGCEIGARPIDIHLSGLRALGAEILRDGDRLICSVKGNGSQAGRLRGAEIRLPFPSVGATENLMMAAALAEGSTRIIGAAREPEIWDLQQFLNACGGRVSGAGTGEIYIEGRQRLHGAVHSVVPDRIEAGTFLTAAAMTGGEILLTGAEPEHLKAFTELLEVCGCRIRTEGDRIALKAPGRLISPGCAETGPYPLFPTDLQSPFLAAMTMAEGTCRIRESIFENRFKEVKELVKMGANVELSGREAMVKGVARLYGANVSAGDLRGGASLVLAGLAAEGKTIVENICHIDRGYDKFNMRLQELGAQIVRYREPEEAVTGEEKRIGTPAFA